MGMPADHAMLIRRADFPVPSSDTLDAQEQGMLARYGYWLEALASGIITPVTPEQRQFVQVARGEAEPRSAFEIAWVKCRRAAPASSVVGPLELANRLARFNAARAAATAVREEYSARRLAVMEQVRSQLDTLEAEYADRLAATGDEAARLEAEAREAVLAHGASFQHSGVHAVYARGRVTWDNKGLAQYMESHPEIGQFRRIGAPSVSLRFQPAERPDAAPDRRGV